MIDKPAWGAFPITGDAVRLSVPARADYVHMLRSLASSLAVRLDFTYDDLEDLALAVSEAAAYLLRLQPEATTLSLAMSNDGDTGIEVRVSVDGPIEQVPTPDGVQWMMWHVLGALAGEASLTHEDGGPAIRFLKRKTS